jgi:hypothetical protein
MTLVAAAIPTASVASSSSFGVGPVDSVPMPVRGADKERQQNGDYAHATNTDEYPDLSNGHGKSLPQRMPQGFEANAK